MPDRPVIKRSDPVETALDIVVDIPLVQLEDDPYPYYLWMREDCPVVFVPETGRVLVLTWDLCREAGANDAVFGPTKAVDEHVYGKGNVMSLTGERHRVIPQCGQSCRCSRSRWPATTRPASVAARAATSMRSALVGRPTPRSRSSNESASAWSETSWGSTTSTTPP